VEARDEAVVLHVRAYGDSDAIVALFARAHGKVSVFMRGLRSAKRKESLRPLYEIALELRARAGSELYTAGALDVVRPHLRLSEELVRLAAANAVLEAYRDLFHDGDADAGAYALLIETLSSLERDPPFATLARCAERLAAHIGYASPRAVGTLADFRALVDELEHICGHTLAAHRFFLDVAE
jgi:DNA repair protein RecO